MRRKAVDNSEIHRWRALPAADVLCALSEYAKRDTTFHPKVSHLSTRWNVSAGGFEYEILCTGSKFLDMRNGKGGGGAIDMAMHLLRLDFLHAVALLRARGV